MSTIADGSPSAAQSAHLPDRKSSQPTGGPFQGILSMLRAAPTALQAGEEHGENEEDPDLARTGISDRLASDTNPVDVSEVAVPKADIVAVPRDITLPDLIATYRSSGRTRLPVFERTLDQPLGFVHLKDVALRYGFNGQPSEFDVTHSMRELMYVPPSMPISNLLRQMQKERCHMALIIDEYGGVDGLVTIEDLLEQHVGEIHDEHDRLEDDHGGVRHLGAGSYLCPAKMPISEVSELLGRNLADYGEDDEIDSLGGWVSKILNRIPRPGEVIELAEAGIKVRVIKANARKVDIVQITRSETPRPA